MNWTSKLMRTLLEQWFSILGTHSTSFLGQGQWKLTEPAEKSLALSPAGDSQHITVYVCLISTPDWYHQLIRRELHELNWVCQIGETSKMCSVVGPQDQDWKPLVYSMFLKNPKSMIKEDKEEIKMCVYIEVHKMTYA